MLKYTFPDCTATDSDPDNGANDYADSVLAMSKRAVGGLGKRVVEAAGWVSRSRFGRL